MNKTGNSKGNQWKEEEEKKKKKKKNTRVTDKSKTIIDRAFVSNPVRVSSAGVYCLGLSDH